MRALRIGGGEQDAHRPALREPEQRGALGAGGVHHGADVVHALLERRRSGDRVGEPGAALVEQDQPRERGELVEEPGDARVGPLQVQVRDEARHEHEVERPVADDLISDVDVAALRVVGLRRHGRMRTISGGPVYSVSTLLARPAVMETVGSAGAQGVVMRFLISLATECYRERRDRRSERSLQPFPGRHIRGVSVGRHHELPLSVCPRWTATSAWLTPRAEQMRWRRSAVARRSASSAARRPHARDPIEIQRRFREPAAAGRRENVRRIDASGHREQCVSRGRRQDHRALSTALGQFHLAPWHPGSAARGPPCSRGRHRCARARRVPGPDADVGREQDHCESNSLGPGLIGPHRSLNWTVGSRPVTELVLHLLSRYRLVSAVLLTRLPRAFTLLHSVGSSSGGASSRALMIGSSKAITVAFRRFGAIVVPSPPKPQRPPPNPVARRDAGSTCPSRFQTFFERRSSCAFAHWATPTASAYGTSCARAKRP